MVRNHICFKCFLVGAVAQGLGTPTQILPIKGLQMSRTCPACACPEIKGKRWLNHI